MLILEENLKNGFLEIKYFTKPKPKPIIYLFSTLHVLVLTVKYA